jgi:hypothetical protein
MSTGAPTRVLSISSRRPFRPSVRVLWVVVGLLVVVNVVLFLLHDYSIRSNFSLADDIRNLNLEFDTRSDPLQALLTNSAFQLPCEVAQYEECPNLHEAPEVESARKQVLGRRTQELLNDRSFSNLRNVFMALSARGADDDLVKLAGQMDITLHDLSTFATSWYADPAERYALNGREYEAVILFRRFIDLMRVPVKEGEWLSIPGLDATDVPVLADLFCTASDRSGRTSALPVCLRRSRARTPAPCSTASAVSCRLMKSWRPRCATICS